MTPAVDNNSALFLDIDGTILDMARTPDAVRVPAELKASLAQVGEALQGALALVSGRSLKAVDALFSPLKLAAIGCHGVEVRGQAGNVTLLAGPISDTIRGIFQALARTHPGTLLEDKVYALALHYRLAPEARPALLIALEQHAALFAAERISILHGKAVIDVRPAGIDKGVGVRTLLQQSPFRGRRLVFGGDDTTDEDVFRILGELGGDGFSVGKPFGGVDHVFETPRAVRQWLTRIARQGRAA